MADFGYLSDTDDSAVEEVISQAKELSALEQVAAINCSGFTDSTLPDDLETRFRRLKSLPAPQHRPISPSLSKIRKNHHKHSESAIESAADKAKEDVNFSGSRGNPGKISRSVSFTDDDLSIFLEKKLDLDVKSDGDFSDSGNVGSSSSSESKIFSPVKQSKKVRKEKRRIGSSSSSSIDLATPPSSDSESEKKSKSKSKSKSSWFNKISPSKIIGYIFRSPNKSSSKKKSIKSSKSFSASGGGERDMDFDEFLSDLNAYSVEDQRKMLKKALKEQQKMRKEAAEIIKMAKQASAKFDFDDF